MSDTISPPEPSELLTLSENGNTLPSQAVVGGNARPDLSQPLSNTENSSPAEPSRRGRSRSRATGGAEDVSTQPPSNQRSTGTSLVESSAPTPATTTGRGRGRAKTVPDTVGTESNEANGAQTGVPSNLLSSPSPTTSSKGRSNSRSKSNPKDLAIEASPGAEGARFFEILSGPPLPNNGKEDLLLPQQNGVLSDTGVAVETPLPLNSSDDTKENSVPKSPSLFWSGPLSEQEELNWYVPPLPHDSVAGEDIERALQEFASTMADQPRRAWLLQWNYRTRAAAAAAEQTLVEQEAQALEARLKQQGEQELVRIDAEMRRLNDQRQILERELLESQNAFSTSAARAGLHCEVLPAEHPHEPASSHFGSRFAFWKRNAHEEEEDEYDHALGTEHGGRITPQVVEDALLHSGPSPDELAGEYGVAPVGREDLLSRILSFFMQFLAPLVAGMMLALCLGTLVGILDIDTLQRPDSAAQLVLSALLGFVIVYLMGELFHSTVATLARCLEERIPGHVDSVHVPRYHGNRGVAIALLVLAVGLGLAEVTAEGMGIRQLHQQQIMKQNRFRSTPTPTGNQPGGAPATPVVPSGSEELPVLLYLLIGTLISGPYLGYKAARGWNENESHLREAWLMHRQRLWLDERRKDKDVQDAYHHAYNVERIEGNLGRIREQILMLEDERMDVMNAQLPDHLQTRRREARAAAVGEAGRLQQSLEELVDAHEPMPQKPNVNIASDPNYHPDRRNRTSTRR